MLAAEPIRRFVPRAAFPGGVFLALLTLFVAMSRIALVAVAWRAFGLRA